MEEKQERPQPNKHYKAWTDEIRFFHTKIAQEPTFLRRRLDLMVRDPMAIEAVKEVHTLPLPIDEYTDNVLSLASKLEEKWNVSILFTRDQKYRFELAGWTYDDPIDPQGTRPLVMSMKAIEDGQKFAYRGFEPVWFHRLDASRGRKIAVDPLVRRINGDRLSSDDKLYVEIDLNLIDNNDRKRIKKLIDEAVDRCLKARKLEGRPKRIMDEPEGLWFIYDCKEDTFQNYLRWYDIHTQERLGFRLIAFLEKYRSNLETYEEWLKKLSTTTWKVGKDCAKGEDRIEKGVKLIWTAIHRKPYSSKKVKPVMEDWTCPVHGKEYDATCKHCKGLSDRFDRINSVDKGYRPTMELDHIDTLILKRDGKLPAKNTRYSDDE